MLVLFDFDGTLVDSRQRVLASMDRAYAGQGVPCPEPDAVLGTVGLQPEYMLADLSPDLAPHLCRSIALSYQAHSLQLRASDPDTERPFPGAHDALLRVRAAGHRLGVVTGKSASGLDQNLDQLGWRALFDDLRPADGAPGKPDPTLILHAISATGASPRETVMVGDTSFDMIMARRAGVAAVGVSWGYHPPERLAAAGAQRIIRSFDALAPLLDAHADTDWP